MLKGRIHSCVFAVICVFLLSQILLSSSVFAQNKGITYQVLIKKPSGAAVNATGVTVNVKILAKNGCILREEEHINANINNGYLGLSVLRGTPTGADPALAGGKIFDNSAAITGLTCINLDGTVNLGTTSYTPSSDDTRKLRIRFMDGASPVVADFNIRSGAFAYQAEQLGGKSASDFVSVNNGQGVTQNNVESIFNRFTKLDSILNNFNASGTSLSSNITGNAATATSAVSFTGPLSGDVTGTQGSTVIANGTVTGSKIHQMGATSGQVLKWSGSSWVASNDNSGGVGSVTSSDITTAMGYTVANSADVSSGLAAKQPLSSNLTAIAGLSPLANQVIKWNGSAWVASTDETGVGSSQWTTSSSDIYYNTGNVGIGTSSPTEALEVVNGSLSIDGENNGLIVDAASYKRAGFMKYAGYGMGLVQKSGSMMGQGIFVGRITGSIKSPTTVTKDMVFDDSTGNIGIGTSSPGAKLEVAGQVKITGGTPGAGKVLTSDASGLASWATPASGSSQWTTTGSDIYYNTGNVGIGTSSPSNVGGWDKVLDVHGANHSKILTTETSGGISTIFYANSWQGAGGVGTESNHPFKIVTNWSERMRVDTSGNVGIGTPSPGAKLEVAGQVKITGGTPGAGKVLTSDASGLASWETPASGSSQWTTSSSDIYYNTGNVGIGTSSPTEALEVVNGSLSIDGENNGLIVDAASYKRAGFMKYAGYGMGLVQKSGSMMGQGIFVGRITGSIKSPTTVTKDMVFDDSTGNIGIGTSSPGAKLEVAGQVKITGGTPGAGKVLTSDASGLASWATPTVSNQPYVIAGTFDGTLDNSQLLTQHPFPLTVNIPANCTNSRFEVAVAATTSTVITLEKCTGSGFTSCTQFGTATISASGKVASFTCTATSFTAGTDSLVVRGPATADATAGTAGWAIYGTR